MSVFILTLGYLALHDALRPKPITDPYTQVQTSVFNNDFFTTSLAKTNKAETFVKFSQIQSIIETAMATVYPSNADRDQTMVNQINTLVGTKRVSISNADDLYNFSTAASYNWKNKADVNNYPYVLTIQKILDLNYALVGDIDYSTMRAKKFNPIGIDLTIPETTAIVYDYPFTGSFDGQGFTITNLYVADYSYITMIYRFNNDESTDVDLPLAKHYSMFAYIGETGLIKNLMIKNPIFDLADAPEGLLKTSMLVGRNQGLIYNVSVIDTRTNTLGEDISGIRFNVQYAAGGTTFTAAGFVHENMATGRIYNSYFVSKNVVSTGSKFRFNVRPYVYTNSGTITSVAYDNIVVPNVDSTTQPLGVRSYSTTDMKNGTTNDPVNGNIININVTNLSSLSHDGQPITETRYWHYYALDGYPSLIGLEYNSVNGYFEINDEYDLISFSKMIGFQSSYLGLTYNRHNYLLLDDIDMANISTYATPTRIFRGVLSGGTSEFSSSPSLNTNKYIYNLTIAIPYIFNTEYFIGLTSSLAGTIRNINFYNNTVQVTNSGISYGKNFYIGMATGIQESGSIVRNVVSNSTINLGTEAIGRTYAGGISGRASGSITYTAHTGILDGNLHDFDELTINGQFSMGGIVGGTGTNALTLTNSINTGSVTGVGRAANTDFNVSTSVKSMVGGIIGEVNNLNITGNSLLYVTNTGLVSGNVFDGKEGALVYQHIGGIFGSTVGFANQVLVPNTTTFKNGRWENTGNIGGVYSNTFSYLYAAGIGVADTSSTKAEFSYMTNSGSYSITNFNMATHGQYLFYAATIIDNSSGGITLSRAYNQTNYSYGSLYFTNPSELDISNHKFRISPFFTSITDIGSDLIYVQNNGELFVGTTGTAFSVSNELYVSNITLANRVNYRNVYNKGAVSVVRINNNSNVYVSGITWILPYNVDTNSPYVMVDSMNEGKIVTAEIGGNTDIDSFTGTESSSSSFSSEITARNLYVAGLVNINVGEISNVFNLGEITSTYTPSIHDITGTANSFVGGVVTFNYYKISDAANSGKIEYTNDNDSSITYVVGGETPGWTNIFGGLVITYNGGLTLGGIAAAFGDTAATVLTGFGKDITITAELIDSSNNGDIYGKAPQYVRSGGVLGVALGSELTAGTTNNASGAATVGPYVTKILGSGDKVALSLLSNGLNFGNITAITEVYGTYSGDLSSSTTGSDSNPNSQRPGIYASAGGVIGYGLCKMKRMLNHGYVSSTDVAGGIVGATYILGGTTASLGITLVDIDTAVHYGKVKAAIHTAYDSFSYENSINYGNTSFYYADNNTFIFPNNGTFNVALFPNYKRGFGGIFGRLQRGGYGLMQSNNFVNILNMDSAVDMVGRADQSSYGSYIYFRFAKSGVLDSYYTARPNDTTPAALTGYLVNQTSGNVYTNVTSLQLTIRRNSTTSFTVTGINVLSGGTGYEQYTFTRRVARFINSATLTSAQASTSTNATETRRINFANRTENRTGLSLGLTAVGLTNADVSGYFTSNTTRTISFSNYTNTITMPTTSLGTGVYQYLIERVTDNPSNIGATNIFNTNFPLMNPTQSLYIYQANNDVLANKFRLSSSPNYKQFGMYVLASTKGREAGAVLPANVKINKLYKLNEASYQYIDLATPLVSNLVSSGADVDNLVTKYQNMFQVRYSDKSLVLPKIDLPTIGDIVLSDSTNSSPKLEGGIINNTAKTITFNLSNSAFSSSTVNYKVESATLSENAVIAVTGIDQSNHEAFKVAYNARSSNVLGVPYEPTFSGVINTGGQLTFTLRVYSEIAAQVPPNDLVLPYSNFYSDYTIIINRSTIALSVSLNQVIMDGVAVTPPALVDDTYSIASATRQLNPNGTLQAVFLNNNTQLPLGHNLTWKGLFLGTTEIDPIYYSYSLQPKAANNLFGFTVTLSDSLQAGTYTAKYSYYNNSTPFYVEFTKAQSSASSVISLNYGTYSSDTAGTNFTIPPQNTDFMTYIEFGYVIEGLLYSSARTLTVTSVAYLNVPSYVNPIQSYEIKLDGELIETIQISPFSTLESVTGEYSYDLNGRRVYELTYTIKSEANVDNPIVHSIRERDLNNIIVYKNGNQQFNSIIEVERENLLTTLLIDFGFTNSLLNANVFTTITDGSVTFIPELDEISYDYDTFYQIDISYLLETGLKTYTFSINREFGITYNLGEIDVEKKLGVNAYLLDIQFQLNSEITIFYPDIFEADSNGAKVDPSDFDIRAYFDGIDYDEAIAENIVRFRIDGKVSDIDITDYSPSFTLPFGASIERYDELTAQWTSDLTTNFISENENEDKVVLYRIVSENGSNTVYYHITAADVLYNLTIRFTLYFRFANGTIVEASDSSSPIKSAVVLITLRNYSLVTTMDEEPVNYEVTIDPITGDITYPFEGTILNYVSIVENKLIYNQSTLFYYPTPTGITNYLYTFGRNKTGAYGISIVSPKYQGTPQTGLTNGLRYNYSIYLKTGTTGGTQYPWNSPNFLLPNLDSTGETVGRYYFVSGSLRQIIREFAIVIDESTTGSQWGLYDDYTSWDQ